MSKTPETDAIADIDGNWDTKALRMTDHARKLELRLAEAIAATPWAANSETKEAWFERQREKYAALERQLAEAKEDLIRAEVARVTNSDLYERALHERGRLVEELETERIRLAACGVVALADTTESAARAREMLEMLPKYHSTSLGDVIRRVDECMVLREQRDRLAEAAQRCLTYAENHQRNEVEESIDNQLRAALSYGKEGV